MSKKLSLEDADLITERPMSRRSSVAVVGAALIGAAGIVATTPERAEAQCSDSDPYDPAGRGRRCGVSGCSDSDPNDPGGNGRHCRAASGCSDSDPYDPGGNGRHCRRSCSDADPYDPGGAGRHC